ncbi:MAG: DUF6599 family protein [Candidatus Acidiferrales bacterium]
MRKSVLRFAAALFVVSLFACAAGAQGVLPGAFAGQVGAKSGAQLQATDGFTLPGASVLKEYELQSVEAQNYGDGSGGYKVLLYRMKDPTGAYGLYSYLRSSDTEHNLEHAAAVAHSSISSDRALILIGNFVIDARGIDLPKHPSDLDALVSAVKPKASEGPLPNLTEHLPVKGFVERSDKYVLGPVALNEFFPVAQDDWLGFYAGAEAEVAKYRVNGRELLLVLADFPTPQSAQKRLNDIQRDLHVNPADASASAAPIFARRSVTMLAIVSGARNQAEANALLDQIQSDAEVTWNEPTFQFKEPTIGAMIVGAIEGTGVICLFAVIAGIGFGGFRLLTKRLLPDRVFDRSSTMQVLQLGLGSKPINAEDFYGVEGKPPK